MKQVSILLVDDHPLVRDGVRSRLEAVPNFRVVAEAGSGEEALRLAVQHRPSLMLTDIGMAGMSGIELAEACHRQFPEVAILVLSMHDNPEYVASVVRAGAQGYVLKHAPADQLVAAIQAVADGGTWFSSELRESRTRHQSAQDQLEKLTPRERFILSGLARGFSNKRLADELQISVRTVETHRFSLKRKLNISGQAELVKFAVENLQMQDPLGLTAPLPDLEAAREDRP
jgi:two-component system, NarL family, nitrate/nitrite response regulator NarL